jgi:acetyl/propionyl-CoA carboxylase alpha subunit
VQLLADAHGQAIALNGRDCSIQRRHQKIIEEGPPVAAPPAVWKKMEQAAVALAKEVRFLFECSNV